MVITYNKLEPKEDNVTAIVQRKGQNVYFGLHMHQ